MVDNPHSIPFHPSVRVWTELPSSTPHWDGIPILFVGLLDVLCCDVSFPAASLGGRRLMFFLFILCSLTYIPHFTSILFLVCKLTLTSINSPGHVNTYIEHTKKKYIFLRKWMQKKAPKTRGVPQQKILILCFVYFNCLV